jgi:hypothetical protein
MLYGTAGFQVQYLRLGGRSVFPHSGSLPPGREILRLPRSARNDRVEMVRDDRMEMAGNDMVERGEKA